MRATLIEKIPAEVDGDILDDGASNVLGGAFLPESWLENGDFSPFEFFIGRVNVSEFFCKTVEACKNLSAGGSVASGAFLYFFAEAKNFKFNCLKPRVRLFFGEADAYTEFNDGFFDCEEAAYKLVKNGGGAALVFENEGDNVVLLSLPAEVLPFEISGERLEYYIPFGDFEKGDFSKCKIRA